MTHMFAPHTVSAAPIVVNPTPTPSSVITPSQVPVQGSTPAGGSTPSFLGSSVLPPQTPDGSPSNQKKLLGS